MGNVKPPKKEMVLKKSKGLNKTKVATPDFKSLFEYAPGLYLVLLPDKNFTIVAVSHNYAQATLTKKDEIIGRGLFDVFPDNPNDITADGESNLKASLLRVIKYKKPDAMPTQKYDIRKPGAEGVQWEAKYWNPLNTPVLSEDGEVTYIIHCVADVSAQIRGMEREKQQLARNIMLEVSGKKSKEKLKESEEKFVKAFSASPIAIGIATIDDGKYIDVNESFENVTGYSRNEIIGHSSAELNLMVDKNLRDGVVEGLRQNISARNKEWAIRTKSGSIRYVLTSSEAIVIGGKICMISCSHDITDRKLAEEEIKQTNHFLDSVLENIPNMVFVKDAKELRFVRFNKAGENLLGISAKDLIGKNDHDFFPKEQADWFTSKDRMVLASEDVVDIPEEEIDSKNGKLWLHTRKMAVRDNQGNPTYLLGISEDITEKRKIEEQIKQLNRELTQNVNGLELANKELESFTYSVSHDLRAPLRAIRGYTDILKQDYSGSFDCEGLKMMEALANNAIRMSHLIDDLLEFSRMGKTEMRFSKVDMKAVANTSVNTVRAAYNYALNTSVEVKDLLPAYADPSLMENVFTNLISNAVKYSSGVERPNVEISSFADGDEHIYMVKDNGVGFDMKYYDKLFGVFQRLHSKAEFEGTGVGLALVKRIITRHGGRVWAEAEPNRGATFYIALRANR